MRNSRVVGVLLVALAMLPHAGSAALAATHPAAPAQTEAQAAEQRIQTLQAALQISPAQMPQWTSFAQAMRDNASATDALFRNRATSAATMNAADNMKSYASVARAYADNTQKLSDAFQTLYAALSDQQKQTADTMFRQQATEQAGTKK
ncbi:Spy/CpxP family protein refolding chaperone [Lichenicola sp.]|uniref:Spy/CpxP family protein refolding chaperone n=1 Tax=Lichenicola sp. TaxID=2804529 RepID=UPI003B00A315